MPIHNVLALGVLARLQILRGNPSEAVANIQRGNNDPYRESSAVFYLPVLFAQAELTLRKGDPSSALAATDDLIARLRRYGMRSRLPEALYLQGKALLGLNQNAPASERFLEAQTIARAIGSRRMLWRILFALSQIEKDPGTAERLLQEARAVLEFILAHFRAEHIDLQETFRKQPDVLAVIGTG